MGAANTMGSTLDNETTDDELPDEPRLRLSWTRLLAVLAVVALVATAGTVGFKRASAADEPLERSWSVPYVDVTLTPTYEFQDPRSNPARDVALAFVVADPSAPCTPSWGGAYTLDEASRRLELDRRITQLRDAGGDIMVSFGGQANDELATVCTDPPALAAAYRSVVERYDSRVIDLDVEGTAVADHASILRRAQAVASIQKERAAAGEKLAVWLTLPVTTDGLTADGVALVQATLRAGVDLTGVNAMTMDFGDASHPVTDLLAATRSALQATVDQVGQAYRAQGVTLDEAQRWAHVGATPMIGQNDVRGEVFTLADAQGLADYAVAHGLGRVSTWSLNRDGPCSASFADVAVVSDTCSSVPQAAQAFAKVFTTLPGRAPALARADDVTVHDQRQVVDDPTRSPYPVWRPEAQYPEAYKVVRRGVVYQAKWYTQGQDPASTASNPWDTPWALVGPVGPDDVPFTPVTVPAGTHPDWNPETLYGRGDAVLLDGLPYEARWPTKGEVPPSLFPVGPDSAWVPLFAIPGEPGSS
jgi:chitinase